MTESEKNTCKYPTFLGVLCQSNQYGETGYEHAVDAVRSLMALRFATEMDFSFVRNLVAKDVCEMVLCGGTGMVRNRSESNVEFLYQHRI